MQLSNHKKVIERILYYWSKVYTSNLKIGDEYDKLRKTICIMIIDDEMPQFKGINKAHTKWQLREEKYKEIILTSFCEIHIIELPKAIKEYEKNKEDEILQWMMFLENPEDMEVTKIMEENEDIKEAKEELDEIRQDEMLRRDAIRAELLRKDYKQCMYEAKIDGIEEGKKETAKKMLEKGIELETIIEITGLTKEEIEN